MKKTLCRSARVGVAALILGWSPVASAQNYRELPIGGRTATMGGAATAAGNDSAMPYLNPAGLAGVPGDIFAISATVYGYTHRSIEDYFYPNGTNPLFGYEPERESFSMSSINELPSSVMYFRHFGKPSAPVHHHVGISLVIPAARRIDIVASAAGSLTAVAGEAIETSSLTFDSNRYYIGPSYAVGFGDSFRVGLSGYMIYGRAVYTDATADSITMLGGSTTVTYNDQRSQIIESLSVVPIIGIQARLVSHLHAGVGFAPPSLPVTGRLRMNSSSSSVGVDPASGSPQSSASISAADVNNERNEPLRLNFGLAWEDRKRFSLAADVIYFAPRVVARVDGVQANEDRRSGELTRRYATDVSYELKGESVVDFSIGGEVALGKLFALRAGVFSDLSAAPKIGSSLDEARRFRIDRYGTSLGLGLTAGSFDTTVGVVLVRGEGQFGAPDTWVAGEVVPVKTTESTAMLVLSGAVTEEEAKKKIQDTLPIPVPMLPDLGGHGAAPMPRRQAPLPPEPKPLPPQLKSRPPESSVLPPPGAPGGSTSPAPATGPAPLPKPLGAP
jgi:hypothetical protein